MNTSLSSFDTSPTMEIVRPSAGLLMFLCGILLLYPAAASPATSGSPSAPDAGRERIEAIKRITRGATIKSVVFEFDTVVEKRLIIAKTDPNGLFFKVIADPGQLNDDRAGSEWFVGRYGNNYWSYTVDTPTSSTNLTLWFDEGNGQKNNGPYLLNLSAQTQLALLLSMGIGDVRMETLKWDGDHFTARGFQNNSYDGKITLGSANAPEIRAAVTIGGRTDDYVVKYVYGPETAAAKLPSAIIGRGMRINLKHLEVAPAGTLLSALDFNPSNAVPAGQYQVLLVTNNGVFAIEPGGALRSMSYAAAESALRGDPSRRMRMRLLFGASVFLATVLVALRVSRALRERRDAKGGGV